MDPLIDPGHGWPNRPTWALVCWLHAYSDSYLFDVSLACWKTAEAAFDRSCRNPAEDPQPDAYRVADAGSPTIRYFIATTMAKESSEAAILSARNRVFFGPTLAAVKETRGSLQQCSDTRDFLITVRIFDDAARVLLLAAST